MRYVVVDVGDGRFRIWSVGDRMFYSGDGSPCSSSEFLKRDAYDLASKWGKRETAAFLKPLLPS